MLDNILLRWKIVKDSIALFLVFTLLLIPLVLLSGIEFIIKILLMTGIAVSLGVQYALISKD